MIMSLWLLFNTSVNAQSLRIQDLPINISYFGENGIHPGLKLGIEYPLASREKEKERLFRKRQEKRGSKLKTRELFLTGNIGSYIHPNNHLGVFVGTDIGARRIKGKNGNFVELNLGIGYLQRLYTIDTYTLDANESLQRIGAAGNGSFMLGLAPSFGRDLSVKKGRSVKWFVKPGLQITRYNHSFLPNGFLELGVQFRLNASSSKAGR